MELIPKIGILVGIAVVIIVLPFWITVTVANNEYIFAKVFFDEDIHLTKMQETESYKAMLERYPDVTIQTRTNPSHGSSIELLAYSDDSENEFRVNIHYSQQDDRVWEDARCQIFGDDHRTELGTIPPELIDDSPIPKALFVRGTANQEFAADFIKYTNCLEMSEEEEMHLELEADHHVAIPENTGMPGCQKDLTCFEPYSLKIKVGEVVSFRNFDSEYHTVTSGSPEFGPDGEFDSSLMEAGDQFLHKFTDPDEYEYFCMVHPWQTGKIIVHEK